MFLRLCAEIKLRDNLETAEKIETLWSEYLFEEGIIPKGYAGLPDNLIISNLHQEGYIDGLYVGYILSMIALVDNDAPKDLILSIRNDIRPNLIENHYNYRQEFIDKYKSDKYYWVEKVRCSDNDSE